MTVLNGARKRWPILLLVLGSFADFAHGDDDRSDEVDTKEWLWAFAPGAGYSSTLGWSASAGVFAGPVVDTPSDGYKTAVGVLLLAEASSRGRRLSAGVHIAVSPVDIPLVGTLGAGVNAAFVEIDDGVSPLLGPGRTTLIGPEVQIVFVWRFRVGYLVQTRPDPSHARSRSGWTWSIGLGF